MSNNLRQAAQQALEALELLCPMQPHTQAMRDAAINTLRSALAEPEQEPQHDYRTRYDRGCYKCGSYYCPADCPEPAHLVPRLTKQEPDGISWLKRDSGYFTAPTPQREHITDGSPCWCNPDVIEEEGGDVIVHNYEDNWQQYAKPGETAQQCIERHRGEQDALMKLYATPRRPLTDEQCDSILLALDEWAKRFDHYDYGLPLYNEELRAKAREVMRIAHGITGEQK